MSTLIERMTSAGSEGARRATGDLADGGAAAGVRDPEVSEKAKRRRFPALNTSCGSFARRTPARVTVMWRRFYVARDCTRRIYRVGVGIGTVGRGISVSSSYAGTVAQASCD